MSTPVSNTAETTSWAVGHDFIGRGWAHPCVLDPTGGVRLVGGSTDLDMAIRMIIETRPGERVMRPDFGCRVWEYVFDTITARTLGLIEHAVTQALQRWEPRIVLDLVRAVPGPDAGTVLIDISYTARATNDRRSLVHPFYVIPREP